MAFLLRITAAVNITSGVSAAAFPEKSLALLYASAIPITRVLLGGHVLLWITIATIGIGYAVASRNPGQQTAMIWVGGLGKWLAVLVWGTMWIRGITTHWILVPIVFDGVWGTLLLRHLLSPLRKTGAEGQSRGT